MSKKSDWTLLRFCQHRQLGLWGWGWTIKSLCCHLRIWRLETVMQGRPSYTPQTLKTLPGIPWSDGSFDNQPGHNLTTTSPGNQHQYAFSSYWSFIATCYMFCFASHMGSICTCYWARRRMRWTSANMSEERHCKLLKPMSMGKYKLSI